MASMPLSRFIPHLVSAASRCFYRSTYRRETTDFKRGRSVGVKNVLAVGECNSPLRKHESVGTKVPHFVSGDRMGYAVLGVGVGLRGDEHDRLHRHRGRPSGIDVRAHFAGGGCLFHQFGQQCMQRRVGRP